MKMLHMKVSQLVRLPKSLSKDKIKNQWKAYTKELLLMVCVKVLNQTAKLNQCLKEHNSSAKELIQHITDYDTIMLDTCIPHMLSHYFPLNTTNQKHIISP